MFRVKTAATRTMSQLELQRQCVNAACFLPFAPHNAEILTRYLQHYYPRHAAAVAQRSGPTLVQLATKLGADGGQPGSAVAASTNPMQQPAAAYEQYFVSQHYVDNVLHGSIRKDAPPPCTLPLPQYGLTATTGSKHTSDDDNKKDSEESIMARQFYHISAVEKYEAYDFSDLAPATLNDVIKDGSDGNSNSDGANTTSDNASKTDKLKKGSVLYPPSHYATSANKLLFPRCGLTGKFFQREELVDNLMMAASPLYCNYQESPFWVSTTHPQLHKYLKLIGETESGDTTSDQSSITIALNSVVFAIEDIDPYFPAVFLHPSLVPDPSSLSVAGKGKQQSYDLSRVSNPAGMNIATGFISKNDYFSKVLQEKYGKGYSGAWVSLDQVLRYRMKLKDGTIPEVILSKASTSIGTAAPVANVQQADDSTKKGKKGAKKQSKKTAAPDSTTKPTTKSDKKVFTESSYEWTGNGTLVTLEEWELYNAQQLAVPGRLALRQSARDDDAAPGLFE